MLFITMVSKGACSSLTLSVVLFVSASAFGIYLKQAAELSVVDVDYDIFQHRTWTKARYFGFTTN